MSDAIQHECGIAHIRLLKPLDFYKKKYGTAFYGINKMYLIMEKQHNRGQDPSFPKDEYRKVSMNESTFLIFEFTNEKL